MPTQVIVKHPKYLGSRLWSMKIAEEFCDATVVINGKSIPVHKVVLAAASGYFKHFFKKTSQNVVTFRNVDKNAFESLLTYCYGGTIKITLENAKEVLTMARILSMNEILDKALKIFEKTYSFDDCFSRWNIDQMGVVEKLYEKRTCISEKAVIAVDSKEKSKTKSTSGAVQQNPTKITSHKNIDKKEVTSHKHIDKKDFNSSVQDDLIIAVGGSTPEQSKTLEILDSKNRKWISNNIDNELMHISSVYLNNKIFLIGGKNIFGQFVNNVNCYNLKSGAMEVYPPMKYSRQLLKAVQCDGFLFAMGGQGTYGTMPFVEKFNPATKRWTEVASMKVPRANLAAVVLNHNIYAVGGFSVSPDESVPFTEVYSVAENQWKFCAPMNRGRSNFGLASISGRLYAVGGHTNITNMGNTHTFIEVYDPPIDRWSILVEYLSPMHGLSAINFKDKLIIASVMFNGFGMSPVTEIFDPTSKKYEEQMAPMNLYREHFDLIRVPRN